METTVWKIYTGVTEAWEAMLESCKEATTSIDLEQFIFVNDEIGKRFLDVCTERAAAGVKVRILCDAAGSFGFFSSSFLNDLRRENLEISFFNSFIPGTLRNHSIWLFRDHKKLLVVDSKVGFTGSISVTSEIKDWRDTHVKITGEVVHDMQHAFNAMWERAQKKKYRPTNPLKVGSDGFNYVSNNPRPRKRFLYHRLVDAMRGAQKYIYLTTPYFVPDRRFLRVLKLARRRGVDVRLIVPEKSDHPVVDLGGQSFFATLLRSGVKIYLHKDRMIHTKVAIIDNEWTTIGSLNFDNISFLYNFEGNLISHNKRFIDELKTHFLVDMYNSKLLTEAEWEKRPFTRKILEIMTGPLKKML